MGTNRALRATLWVGFGLRLFVAVWNGFFGPSFGAQSDALGMHQLAAQIAAGTYPETFRLTLSYAYVLGAIYKLAVPSLFLGSFISCVIWLFSAFALLESLRILRVGRSLQVLAMLIYGVLPSSVLWTAVTMREPFELLLVNLAFYAALRVIVDHHKPSLILLIAALPAGALFHATFVGWSAWLIATVFALEYVIGPGFSVKRVALMSMAVIACGWIGFRLFTMLYSYPLDRGLAYAVSSYQSGGMTIGARTDYRFALALNNASDLLVFIPIALAQYLFEPMPWRVATMADLEPVAENLLRFVLILQVFAILKALPASEWRPTLFAFAAFLILETAWALGTFNWGTAARHHVPSMGLLLIAAFSYRPLPVHGTKRTSQAGLALAH